MPLAAGFVAALAGCASPASLAEDDGAAPEPQPVDLDDSGEFAGAFATEWAWTVTAPMTLVVGLELRGAPAGEPLIARGASASLTDGNGVQRVAVERQDHLQTQRATLVAFEDEHAAPGVWTLLLSLDGGSGTYHVSATGP